MQPPKRQFLMMKWGQMSSEERYIKGIKAFKERGTLWYILIQFGKAKISVGEEVWAIYLGKVTLCFWIT